MAITAAAAAVIGAGVAAYGAVQQGQAANAQAKYQATIANQQAQSAREQAGANEQAFRQKEARAAATRRALLGGTGIDTSSGSPLLTSEDFAGETELQALRIRNGGDIAATRLDEQAGLDRLAGANAETAGYFRAGSSLLSGIGNAALIQGGWGRTGIPLESSGASGGINLNSTASYNPSRFYIPNG